MHFFMRPSLVSRYGICPTAKRVQFYSGFMSGDRASSLRLTFAPATDDRTDSGLIEYRVFVGTAEGAEDFTQPASTIIGTSGGVVGALLPQILMIVGGIRMMFGDVRGRRLVVLSIPIGFIYVVAVAMQAYYPGFALMLGIPIFTVWLAFFYYLVVTSQVGTDPRRGRRLLSTAVMVLAVAFLVVYASTIFETLTRSSANYMIHQFVDYPFLPA